MLALVLLLALGSAPATAVQDPAERARSIVSTDDGYQRYLPGEQGSGGGSETPTIDDVDPRRTPAGSGGRTDERDGFASGADRERMRMPGARGRSADPSLIAGPSSPVWGVLAWVVVGVLVIGLVAWAARSIGVRRRASPRSDATPRVASDAHEVEGAPEAPRPTSDVLAAEGWFTEAIHALLLESLAGLERNGELDLAPSCTSREAVARSRLDEGRRDALAALAREVEVALFAARPADVEAWERCRGHVAALGTHGAGP